MAVTSIAGNIQSLKYLLQCFLGPFFTFLHHTSQINFIPKVSQICNGLNSFLLNCKRHLQLLTPEIIITLAKFGELEEVVYSAEATSQNDKWLW